MAIHVYGVLDPNGVKLTDITADNALIGTGWWPGFGAALIDEGPLPPEPPPAPPPTMPNTWKVYPALAIPMNVGDEYNPTGAKVTAAANITTLTPLPVVAVVKGPVIS